jgi:putative inorganic carbon (HCO3(-)) transporter
MAARVWPAGLAPAAAALLACAAIGVTAGIDPRLAVFATLGLVFAVLTFVDLTAGLVILILVVFAETTPVAGPALSFTKLTGLLLASAWLARVATRPAGAERLLFTAHPVLSYALLAFVVWVTIGSVWAEAPSAALTEASRFLLVAVLYVIVYTAVATRDAAIRVLAALIAATAVISAYGLALRPEASAADLARVTSTIGDPNVLAAILVAGFSLAGAAIFALRDSTGLRVAAGVAAALCLGGMFLTGSRGGLVCFGVALLVAVLIAGRWRAKLTLLAVAIAIGSVAYLALYAPPEIRDRLGNATQGEIQQQEGRFTLWAVGWRVVQDEPLTGIGAGNFKEVSARYVLEPGSVFRTDRVIDNPGGVHNSYLQLLAETGVIGLALYLAIVLSSLAAGLRAARIFEQIGDWRMEIMARGTVVAMAGVLTANFFIGQESGKVVWLLLALGPALLGVAMAAERNGYGAERSTAASDS